MLIKEVMSKNPQILSPQNTLREAAEKMRKLDVGFLPIGENDRLVGALTDRDLVTRAISAGKTATTAIKDVMSERIHYCMENDSLEKAAEMMSRFQIRRLAVLNDNKRLVGVISLGDIATKSHNAALAAKLAEAVCEAEHA